MNNTIILCPTWELAQAADADLTVEAEYGSFVKEGDIFTAAHHQSEGPYKGTHIGGASPAPCNNTNIPTLEDATIVVSHIDLDTLGGCMRANTVWDGCFLEEHQSFWDLAEFVDVNGPQKLDISGASDDDLNKLYAWWWYQEEVIGYRFSRTENTDVTSIIEAASAWLTGLLMGDEALIEKGKAWRKMMEGLNENSFIQMSKQGTILRIANRFVNHLYDTPTGEQGKAIVTFYPTGGNITISKRDAELPMNCKSIVQHLWGTEAGGHQGIAGSPRGKRMTIQDCLGAMAMCDLNLV